jgi:hypothetical protein
MKFRKTVIPGIDKLMRISKKSIFIVLGIIALALGFYWTHPLHAEKSPNTMNLEVLKEYKWRWMVDNHKTLDDTPSWDDLKYWLTNHPDRIGWSNGMPYCPDGGTYILGRVRDPVRVQHRVLFWLSDPFVMVVAILTVFVGSM